MLPKANRLNLKQEFKQVITGRRLENDLVKIVYTSTGNESTKIGISVSGKYFKQAVDRNRARRIVSRGLELLYPRFAPGFKVIALPKVAILTIRADELALTLEKILRKEGLIK